MTYLAVRNWEHYQHKDLFKKSKGRPPWIKFYRDLLEDTALLDLPLAAQLLFDRLLLLAASQRNAIRSDSEWIANKIGMSTRDVSENLPLLLKGGWLSQTKTPRRSQLTRNSNAPKSAAKEKRSNEVTSLKSTRDVLERYVRLAGFEYSDDDLRADLVNRGADDLLAQSLLSVAEEVRQQASADARGR